MEIGLKLIGALLLLLSSLGLSSCGNREAVMELEQELENAKTRLKTGEDTLVELKEKRDAADALLIERRAELQALEKDGYEPIEDEKQAALEERAEALEADIAEVEAELETLKN